VINGNVVTIGSKGIAYAAVQNFGSADRAGGSIGAQARIAGRSVGVAAHRSSHDPKFLFELRAGKTDKGRAFKVPVRKANDKRKMFDVAAHERFQNIPARPFAVFRPEDPARLLSAAESFFASIAARLGKAGAA
jgi:phage gpG-like protein